MPAGQTSLVVAIPTVTDNVVEPNRVLTVSLAPSTGYQVGSPASTSVTITSSVVPTLTITSSTSTVSQGGAASFTITADQAPVKDTSVNFAVQGTAQPGQNYVPLAGTALLKAGQTQVTVVLQSLQNNVTVRADRHDRRAVADQGGPGLREGGGTGDAGRAHPVAHRAESQRHPAGDSAANRSKLQVGQHCTVQIDGENNVGRRDHHRA